MRFKYWLPVLFLIYSLPLKSNEEIKRGLYFRSFEVDKDKRTCLDLTPVKPLTYHQGFSMEFDFQLRRYNQMFGYVLRIICNDTLNVDLLANLSSDMVNFSMVVKNRTAIQYKNSEIGDVIENSWIKVRFVFDPVNNQISLSLNGVRKDATCRLKGLNRFNMYFGGNRHNFFSTTDIVPMTVKDIRIFDEKKNLLRYWELNKHCMDAVYDECVADMAVVRNPVWEIDRHAKWNIKENLALEGQGHQVAFDRDRNNFYFVGDKMIFVYDVNAHKIDSVEVCSGTPFNIARSNHVIYDPKRCVLIAYDLEGKRLTAFDFSTRQWENRDNLEIRPLYSHHNRLLTDGDSLLVTFGGYGHHKYNSMFYKCRTNHNIWDATDLSYLIPPRYLSSMGRLDDKNILLFGGFGNESGLQEEFPRNYYDLYSIHTDNLEVKKIWELPNPKEHFTNSNSLVIDKNHGKFYALAYPNKRYASKIMLHEYQLDKPVFRALGDSIPYFFNDVESYCDLFLSSDGSELYAVTLHNKSNISDINVYSIAYPPLNPKEITQNPPKRSNIRIWLLLTILPAILAGLIIIYRKRKISGNVEAEQISDDTEAPMPDDIHIAERKPSSIHLLGNFQVVDSAGIEITKNFTPTTTQLFLLLLMSTIQNGKGITSQELRNILWYDKDDVSAGNNQYVNINKLRSILKSFKEITVVNSDGYWSVQFEKTVFCDYGKTLPLIKMLQNGNSFNKKLLTELVDITQKGKLLPFTHQTEWLESYQTDYANLLIECLIQYSKHEELAKDLSLLLKIADVILLHDDLDENAIQLKCYALFHSGRKNQALQAFNKFTADYENLLAAKHNLIFDELIRKAPIFQKK